MGLDKSPKPAKVVDAEKFILRDANGLCRAELGLLGGRPCLSLFDGMGICRTRMVVSADGSTRLSSYDRNGQLRATVLVPPEGDPRLDLAHKRQPALPSSAAVPLPFHWKALERSGESIRTAQGLFHQLCVTCHGADGRGKRSRSMPNLPDFASATWQAERTNSQITASILNGRREIMPAFDGRLSADQARDLVAFIRSFGPGPVQPIDPEEDDYEVRFRQLQQEFDDLKKQLRDLSSPSRKP
jgi:mono/diheme cytochrome c family protein